MDAEILSELVAIAGLLKLAVIGIFVGVGVLLFRYVSLRSTL